MAKEGTMKIKARMNIKKSLKTNPRVDEKTLFEFLRVLRMLRKRGLPKSGYEVGIPFSRGIHLKHEDRS